MFTNWSVGRITYVTQLQLTMALVMAFGCVVLVLHSYIAAVFPSNAAQINPKVIAKAQRLAQRREREHGSRSSTGGCCGQLCTRGRCGHSLRTPAITGCRPCGKLACPAVMPTSRTEVSSTDAAKCGDASALHFDRANRTCSPYALQAPGEAARALHRAAVGTRWTRRGQTAMIQQMPRRQTASTQPMQAMALCKLSVRCPVHSVSRMYFSSAFK